MRSSLAQLARNACVLAVALVLIAPAFSDPQAQGMPVARDDQAITLVAGRMRTRVEFWGDRIIRVTHALAAASLPPSGLAVNAHPEAVRCARTEDAHGVMLSTPALKVRVDRSTGRVTFLDAAGAVVTREAAGGTSLHPTVVGGQSTLAVEQRFTLAPGEAIYGLGQHQNGLMNRRNATIHLQQKNGDVAVPVLVSSRGYGVLWNDAAVTDVNVGGAEQSVLPSARLRTEDGTPGGLTARYYAGRNFEKLVAVRTDPDIDFAWGDRPPLDLPKDGYSVRWTGSFEAERGGEYTLLAEADDGLRVFVDDRPVIDRWGPGPGTDRARVRLAARSRHRLRVEYDFEGGWTAGVRLSWRLPPPSAPAVVWTSEAGDAVDYFLFLGPELDDVVAGYRAVTGDAPMLPRWALGLWQSRERYQTQSELLGALAEYRRRAIPLDAIIQDWQYWKPGGWGSHEFDPERYPDPTRMVEAVHAAHAHTIISVWARFDPGLESLAELERAGAVYPPVYPNVYPKGEGRWYDAFSAGGRRIFWKQLSSHLFARGFDGWWLDASEPELGGRWGEMRELETAAGPGAKVFNAYPLMHTTGIYEGQRAETSAKRVFILTRSAFAGQQRNSAVTWSGDTFGTWTVFANQIPAGLNFSLCGIPYWNTDTGGFFGGDPADPAYAELFTRWFQFSTFNPMLRID